MQALTKYRIRYRCAYWRHAQRCAPGILGALYACLFLAPATGALQSAAAKTNGQAAKQKSAHAGSKKPATPPSGPPALNQPVPAFTLPDIDGHPHALAELKGKGIALFFFCGCERCQRCAQTWGQLQRSGAIAPATQPVASNPAPAADVHRPQTVVVFMGDAESARGFAETTGLDMQQTVLLADPRMEVPLAYRALPCPRAFALDGKQTVRYVNSHKDDDPLTAMAATIVTRTLEALTNANQPTQGKREEGRGK
jgi:hypothetical protein